MPTLIAHPVFSPPVFAGERLLSAPPLPQTVRVLIVEDHPATSDGLFEVIQAQAGMEVCGRTALIGEAANLAMDLRPDLMLLDLHLRDGTGWTLIERLSSEGALPRTLVFSVFEESVYAERLLRAGARGYLTKTAPLSAVIRAIRKVAEGHLAVSDAMVTRLLETLLDPPGYDREKAEMDLLSDREVQVLQMFGCGLGNKEIGARLNLSPKTVSTYKARLMGKLGVHTTPELHRVAATRLLGDAETGSGLPR